MEQQQSPPHLASQNPPRSRKSPENPFLKWVTFKELFFVFVACSVVAMLVRTQDKLEFSLVLKDSLSTEHYENRKFPIRGEKVAPLVTDLDSDGQTDILVVKPGKLLKVYSTEPRPSNLRPHRYKFTSKNASLEKVFGDGVRIMAVGVGFLERYQSMVQVRKQVIVVLGSDWTVACFNSNLKHLWSQKISEKPYRITGEAAILVLPSISGSSKKDFGTIFVAGRVDFGATVNEDSFTRKRRGSKEDYEEQLLHSLGHYSTYALEGKSGKLLWKHEPGDFEVYPAYESTSTFVHMKLSLHKYMNHQGELSWHQYSSAIRKVLPHSWYEDTDSFMEVANFTKDRKKTDKLQISEHISKVSNLAMGHLTGYAFGGLRPHAPQEHVENPNVLVIHSMKGLEVLHLETGRPLFTLPLSPAHAIHKDINGDGIVEHVHAIVDPRDDFELGQEAPKEKDYNCYGIALPISPGSKPVFRHSICRATHWTESFLASEKWLPNLNKFGRKRVDHAITEPFTPAVIESPSHQHPLKLASLRKNATFQFPLDVMYDTIFVLSSGRVTSIGPTGQFNWQVDIGSDWDKATRTLYREMDEYDSVDKYLFASDSFTPSNLPFSLKSFGKKTHVLVVGWEKVTVLDTLDGMTTAEFSMPCPPVMKAIRADFTDDGVNDIIIVCADRVLGFSPEHHSGFLHKTSLSLFVGLVIVIVAVYTRQRTGFLMPVKEAQD